MIDCKLDGIAHLNVYSKGLTELGRFLSNFADAPFVHPEDGSFRSIEGYWYWLSSKDDHLRKLSGFAAKAYGRSIRASDWRSDDLFKRKIIAAIKAKLETYPDMFALLKSCKLPLKHYYVFNGKIVEPSDGKWIIDAINDFRKA